MWSMILLGLKSLLPGFVNPIVQGLVTVEQSKITAESDQAKLDEDLSARQIAASSARDTLNLSNGWNAAPIRAVEWMAAIVFGKIWIFDTVLGLGTTTELHGNAAQEMWMAWAFMFGSAAIGRIRQ
jgi:hypothetical protein